MSSGVFLRFFPMAALIDLRTVVLQLQELAGISTAELARLAEVHRPNMLAWLAGKPQVFSEKNQLKVCDVLGWRFGRLRRDMIHHWEAGNDLTACQQVLSAYEGQESATNLMVFAAEGSGAVKAAVVLGLSQGLTPLVILIRRPLGYVMPESITAKTLGIGVEGGIHRLSVDEWQKCWNPSGPGISPADYLESFGPLIFESDTLPVSSPLQNDEEVSFEESLRMTAESDDSSGVLNLEELEWSNVLYHAKLSGMSFNEILVLTKSALGLRW